MDGVRNLVFDLDGTLVDSLPGIEASMRVAIEQNFTDREVTNLRSYIGPPIGKMIPSIFPDATEEQVRSVELAFRTHYDETGYQFTVGYADLPATLEHLREKRYRLYLLTNKPSKATGLILKFLKIDHFFQGVVCVDSEKGKRFESKMLAGDFCSRAFELEAQETCLIGDSADDRTTAKHCNWRFVAVGYGYGGIGNELETPNFNRISCLNDLRLCFSDKSK